MVLSVPLGKWTSQASLFPSPERGTASGSGPHSSAYLPHSFLLSPRVGPLDALVAAHSATVPVRANFLTARASTASALRSSSDEDPESLPFGERPAPGAHIPSSLRSLRPLEPQMGCLAHWPGNQQWRTWLSAEQDSENHWPARLQPLHRAKRKRG